MGRRNLTEFKNCCKNFIQAEPEFGKEEITIFVQKNYY